MALEMVGLRRNGDKFPAELSGGMTKRVALARAPWSGGRMASDIIGWTVQALP